MSTAARTLAAALAYQAHGWHCFVLRPNKAPFGNCRNCPGHSPAHNGETCKCLTCHGFYAATLDGDRIAQMLAVHPEALLAVRTGAPSGIVALDIDVRDNGDASLAKLERLLLEESGDVLPGTVMQVTPGGLHMLYRHPGHYVKTAPKAFDPGEPSAMPGLDLKGDGGYIVVEPSQRPGGGQYRWFGGIWQWDDMPTWPAALDRLLEPAVVERAPVPLRAASQQARGGYAAGALRSEIEQLRQAGEGGRNGALNRAALKLGQLVGAGLLDRDVVVAELTDAALSIGLTHGEIGDGQHRGTLASGLNAGIAQPRRTGGAA